MAFCLQAVMCRFLELLLLAASVTISIAQNNGYGNNINEPGSSKGNVGFNNNIVGNNGGFTNNAQHNNNAALTSHSGANNIGGNFNGGGFVGNAGGVGFSSTNSLGGRDALLLLMEAAGGRGTPGVDYPINAFVPNTGFVCPALPGYYADPAPVSGCQVFHVCELDGRQNSFLCPNATVFNQQYFVCDWWYNFNCASAQQFYFLNENIGKFGVGIDGLPISSSGGLIGAIHTTGAIVGGGFSSSASNNGKLVSVTQENGIGSAGNFAGNQIGNNGHFTGNQNNNGNTHRNGNKGYGTSKQNGNFLSAFTSQTGSRNTGVDLILAGSDNSPVDVFNNVINNNDDINDNDEFIDIHNNN